MLGLFVAVLAVVASPVFANNWTWWAQPRGGAFPALLADTEEPRGCGCQKSTWDCGPTTGSRLIRHLLSKKGVPKDQLPNRCQVVKNCPQFELPIPMVGSTEPIGPIPHRLAEHLDTFTVGHGIRISSQRVDPAQAFEQLRANLDRMPVILLIHTDNEVKPVPIIGQLIFPMLHYPLAFGYHKGASGFIYQFLDSNGQVAEISEEALRVLWSFARAPRHHGLPPSIRCPPLFTGRGVLGSAIDPAHVPLSISI